MTAPAPRLETARLILRAHTIDDFEPMAAMWADPAVTRYIGGRPSARDETWARLLRYIGHWAALGYGFWAIEEKQSGRFLGEAGFADFKRAFDPPMIVPEMGWSLAPAAQGQGYATEAVRAALAWGDAHFGASPTRCIIDPANAASIAVATKCGYREIARTHYKGEPTILFERPRLP
ncbi:MAG: GNAT family N-acetyltransferase [Hyphomonadaceae bacterium]